MNDKGYEFLQNEDVINSIDSLNASVMTLYSQLDSISTDIINLAKPNWAAKAGVALTFGALLVSVVIFIIEQRAKRNFANAENKMKLDSKIKFHASINKGIIELLVNLPITFDNQVVVNIRSQLDLFIDSLKVNSRDYVDLSIMQRLHDLKYELGKRQISSDVILVKSDDLIEDIIKIDDEFKRLQIEPLTFWKKLGKMFFKKYNPAEIDSNETRPTRVAEDFLEGEAAG